MSEVVQDETGSFTPSVFSIKTEKLSSDELLSVYNTDFRLAQTGGIPNTGIPNTGIPLPNTGIPNAGIPNTGIPTTPLTAPKNTPNHKKRQNNKSSIYYNQTEFNINNFDCGTTLLNLDTQKSFKTSRYKWNESPEARQRRLIRNAARMREKRSQESPDEYRARLQKNAEANRLRRQNETEVQRAIRLMKNAERQRLKRANETSEERNKRLKKSAERMRNIRAQTPKLIKPNLADRLIGF